jgi:hypothetical protein
VFKNPGIILNLRFFNLCLAELVLLNLKICNKIPARARLSEIYREISNIIQN